LGGGILCRNLLGILGLLLGKLLLDLALELGEILGRLRLASRRRSCRRLEECC
jgi:hypothetical protein